MTDPRVIPLDDFDPGTRLTLEEDGSALLVLALMPPSWWNGRDALERLGADLARALGVEVEWEDREVLVLLSPLPEDVGERVRAFLAHVKANYPQA